MKLLLPTLAAMLSLMVFGFSANVLPSVLLRAAEDFAIRPERLANVTALKYACYILATIVGGMVADRVGKKAVFIAACCFTGGGALICALARGLPGFYAGSAFIGMGGGMLESLSSALLSDLFPHRRKLMLNLSQVGYCIGAVLGPFLIGRWLPAGVSWRVFFGLLVAMAAALLTVYALARIPKTQTEASKAVGGTRTVIARWSFIFPCVIIFLYVFAETGVALFMNMFLRAHRNAPENWAIYSISVFWVTMTVGRLICAVIPERFSFERLVALLMAGSGVTLLAQGLNAHWGVHLALFGVTGFVFAGTWPLIIGLTTGRNPGLSGTVVGLTVAVGALGCIVAPLVLGGLFLVLPAGGVFALLSLPLFAGAFLALATEDLS